MLEWITGFTYMIFHLFFLIHICLMLAAVLQIHNSNRVAVVSVCVPFYLFSLCVLLPCAPCVTWAICMDYGIIRWIMRYFYDFLCFKAMRLVLAWWKHFLPEGDTCVCSVIESDNMPDSYLFKLLFADAMRFHFWFSLFAFCNCGTVKIGLLSFLFWLGG